MAAIDLITTNTDAASFQMGIFRAFVIYCYAACRKKACYICLGNSRLVNRIPSRVLTTLTADLPKKSRFSVLLIGSLVLLAGCSRSTVVENLSQKQAQEIAAVLLAYGIDASVTKSGRGSSPVFSVEIDDRFYAKSLAVLHDKRLPRDEHASFDDIINQGGFLPPSREIEALKTDRAVALETQELIEALPGVASSRVAVRQQSAPSLAALSLSIVVQVKKGSSLSVDQIRELASRSAPWISPDKISIMVEPEQSSIAEPLSPQSLLAASSAFSLVPFLWLGRIPADDYTRVALVLVVCFILTAFAGCILGYWLGMSRTSIKNRSAQRAVSARLESPDLRLDRMQRGLDP
jgi:type III secretory pathway lipoprotein EscJ